MNDLEQDENDAEEEANTLEDEDKEPKPSGKATASMICGIVSLAGMCVAGPFVIPLAIVGLVLGMMSMKAANKGFAITGIVTSAISLLLSLLAIAGFAFLATALDEQGVTFEDLIEEVEDR